MEEMIIAARANAYSQGRNAERCCFLHQRPAKEGFQG